MTEYQLLVKEFCDKHNLRTDAVTRFLDLVSETGEVAKEFLTGSDYGRKKFTLSDKAEKEIGDLFFSFLALANELNIELDKALKTVLKKYEKRLLKGGAGSEYE